MKPSSTYNPSAAMREYGGFDEQSVDFSIDPDMYKKLDIRKAKLGEENPFDVEKIYHFQLDKDIAKLTSKRGRFQDRNNRFLEIRKMDPEYRRIAVPSELATHGNFKEILEYTTEESWKATSRPYGVQAHKRYLDYLANLPKGPSEEAILDYQQRKQDKELWDKIITGRTELTKKEILRKQQEEIERLEAQLAERNELDHVKRKRLWKEKLVEGDFEALRRPPTEKEFNASMEKWDKGIHFPYDIEGEGFPFVCVDGIDGSRLIKERNKHETMAPEVKYSSAKYIDGNTGAEKAYMEHMVGINLAKVDKYLKKRRKDIVREQEMEAELKQIREKQRRRVGRVERHDIAQAVIAAKFNTIQDKNQKVKKVKTKKTGLLDVEKSEADAVEPSDDEWSEDSTLFGGGVNADGKADDGKEDDGDNGADLGAGYKRQQGGVKIEDILRLNASLSTGDNDGGGGGGGGGGGDHSSPVVRKRFGMGKGGAHADNGSPNGAETERPRSGGPRGKARRRAEAAAAGTGTDGEGAEGQGTQRPSTDSSRKRRGTAVPGLNLRLARRDAAREGGEGSDDGSQGSGNEGGDDAAPTAALQKGVSFHTQSLPGSAAHSSSRPSSGVRSGRKGDGSGGDEGDDSGGSAEGTDRAEGDEQSDDGRHPPKSGAWDDVDHASMKYSSKYKNYQFSPANYLPSYVRNVIANNFTEGRSSKTAKVTPSAYTVKNIKQRNIVFRVVIHYAKKVHPRRLLHLTMRAYRKAQKAYQRRFTNPDGLTRSERDKLALLRKLDLLAQDASSAEYRKGIVNLADHEIPSEEFLKHAKRKQRQFDDDIRRLEDKGVLTNDEQKQLQMLKTRRDLHNEIYTSRLQREEKAKQRAGLVRRYIADTRSLVEATSNFSFLDRWRIHYRTMKQDMVQRAVQLKSDQSQEHILPEFDKRSNDDLIQRLYEARVADRKKSAWKRAWKRRFKYMVTGRERDLEDEDSRIRDVDDLILAARAGNYIEVLEIVLHPSHPVSPNQLNEDGITATYATLMMILKREVLDSEADLANLGLSRLERFWKALRKKVEVEPKLDLVLRALLYCGGKVDFQKMESGVDGTAVIHSAAETGALDMVDWLLKKGTDINLRTALLKKTPLMVALEHNQLEVVDLLLKRGVMMHLELTDVNGWTALHYAACFARVELSVILLTCGSKPNVRNLAGRLASEEARARGRSEVASAIMTFKSDVVEVRTRLENLSTRTEAAFRKHRQRSHIHGQHNELPGVTTAGGATTGTGAGLGGASVASDGFSAAGVTGAFVNVVGSDLGNVSAPNSGVEEPQMLRRPSGGGGGAPLRLPPILPRGAPLASPGREGATTTAVGQSSPPGIAMGSTLSEDLDEGLRETPAERAKKAAAAEAQQREAYERRMSMLVAAADPWNMAPHTQPRQKKRIAMSFYAKPKSTQP